MRKYRKGELRKMSKECWDLDEAFIKWLYPRLKIYKREAGRIIELEYPGRFTYKGKEYNQLELINELIRLCERYFLVMGGSSEELIKESFENDYVQEILDIWAVVGRAMWW